MNPTLKIDRQSQTLPSQPDPQDMPHPKGTRTQARLTPPGGGAARTNTRHDGSWAAAGTRRTRRPVRKRRCCKVTCQGPEEVLPSYRSGLRPKTLRTCVLSPLLFTPSDGAPRHLPGNAAIPATSAHLIRQRCRGLRGPVAKSSPCFPALSQTPGPSTQLGGQLVAALGRGTLPLAGEAKTRRRPLLAGQAATRGNRPIRRNYPIRQHNGVTDRLRRGLPTGRHLMRPRTFFAMGSAIVLLGVAAPLPAVPWSSPGPDDTAYDRKEYS